MEVSMYFIFQAKKLELEKASVAQKLALSVGEAIEIFRIADKR